MGTPERFVTGVLKYARLARCKGKFDWRLYSVAYLLLLVLLAACNAQGADSTTNTPPPLPATPAAPTATLTAQRASSVLFTTPPPVRTEEPLTGGNRNIPSVFQGVVNYTPVQATLSITDLLPPPATNLSAAALAVVQIRRCDSFGCNTPVGSGAIIHPSGLILTAYHVLLTDPDDLTAERYQDFVIAVTENTHNAPQPRYKARFAARKEDQDLALLLIDRDQAGNALAFGQLALPALPLADISNLFGGALPILGYPVTGGEAIHIVNANFSSFDDNGRLIVVNPAPDPGNSGGPALMEQAGRFAIAGIVVRRRSTEGQLSQDGLVRAIDQLDALTWTPKMARAWGEIVQASAQANGAGDLLRLTLTLNTLDLRARPLRLLFYATDAATDQPWQPANASAPLVLWADIASQKVIERQALTLTMPVASLGTAPDRLRFRALLWDAGQGNSLWAESNGVQAAPSVVAMAFTATPTVAPTPTLTATPNPTPTSQPTATPTATLSPTAAPQPTATQSPTVDVNATATMAAASQTIDAAFKLETATAQAVSVQVQTAVAATLTTQPNLTPPPVPDTPTPAVIPTPTPANLAYVVQQGLNFRTGPGTEYTVISSLSKDVVLFVIGQSEDGYWLNVQLSDGSAGWVARPYTDFKGTAPIHYVPTPLAASTPQPTVDAKATAASQTIEAALNLPKP